MNRGLTFVIVSNPLYLRFARVFAVSAARNMPQARIYAHLVNVSDEDATALQKLNPHLEIHRDNVPYSGQEEKTYACSIYSNAVEKCLARGDKYVAYVDSDVIIRKDISAVFDLADQYDITLLHKEGVKQVTGEHVRFLSQFIIFRNTPATIEYVARHVACTKPEQEKNWYIDQICLSRVYDEMGPKITFGKLPRKYVDWACKPGSPVWTLKGNFKGLHILWDLEAARYGETPLSRWDAFFTTVEQWPFMFEYWARMRRIRLTTFFVSLRDMFRKRDNVDRA